MVTERVNWALVDDAQRRGQLDIARAESRALLNEIARRLRRRKDWGLRAINDRAGRELDRFLQGHLKPSLLVLIAGIELAKGDASTGSKVNKEEAPELRLLEHQIKTGAPIDPYLIVDAVEAGCKEPSAALSYNVACFYSQAGNSDRAMTYLRATIELTPPSSWSRLRVEVEGDPVLKPLHRELDGLFKDPLKRSAGKQSRVKRFWI